MPIAFLAALAGSLAIHAAALFLPDIDLSTAPEPPPLTAEIKPLPPLPEPPAKAAEPAQKPKPAPAKPKVARAQPAESPAPGVPPAVEPSPEAQAPAVTAAPEPVAVPAPPPAEPRLPATGRIRYAVYRGDRGFQVGQAEHAWEFADGRYRISIVTETSGLAALFKSVHIALESRGTVTANGLQPERFTTRRNGAETNENADFDWATHEVVLARNGSRYPVRDGAQDLVSFHYQLGYLARLVDGASMGVASGKKFERYSFDAVGEEDIDTPAGRFHTLHVRVQTDSVTELWLATDKQMLPVRIRYTDKKGDSFEQVATALGSP